MNIVGKRPEFTSWNFYRFNGIQIHQFDGRIKTSEKLNIYRRSIQKNILRWKIENRIPRFDADDVLFRTYFRFWMSYLLFSAHRDQMYWNYLNFIKWKLEMLTQPTFANVFINILKHFYQLFIYVTTNLWIFSNTFYM